MNYQILEIDLNSPTKFREKLKKYFPILQKKVKKEYGVDLNIEELSGLILSACRVNDFDVLNVKGKKLFLDEKKVYDWVRKKLLPNISILTINDEDILRLLIFCVEITYQMFAQQPGTKATVTQKGFRERRRTFESILVDQFVGKLGEIMVKKFLEREFTAKIKLDWEISPYIDKYRNDIVNAKKKISIKSSPSLAGIWAEADLGYDFGIHVKCSVPQPIILQFFIEACGFTRLLDFIENKIPSYDNRFKRYLKQIRTRIISYKCGELQTELKGIICGYFKTSEYKPVKKGKKLKYLGEVREERYLVSINQLKYKKEEWLKFLAENNLIKTRKN